MRDPFADPALINILADRIGAKVSVVQDYVLDRYIVRMGNYQVPVDRLMIVRGASIPTIIDYLSASYQQIRARDEMRMTDAALYGDVVSRMEGEMRRTAFGNFGGGPGRFGGGADRPSVPSVSPPSSYASSSLSALEERKRSLELQADAIQAGMRKAISDKLYKEQLVDLRQPPPTPLSAAPIVVEARKPMRWSNRFDGLRSEMEEDASKS